MINGSLDRFRQSSFPNELHHSYKCALNDWGQVMAETLLKKGAGPHQALLERLNYLKGNSLNIPVLVQTDSVPVVGIKKRMKNILKDWLEQNYNSIQKDLAGNITPLRFGVDYRETFIQIWHFLFASINKELARSGFFFNPYGPESDWEGYLPVIHHKDLDTLPLKLKE